MDRTPDVMRRLRAVPGRWGQGRRPTPRTWNTRPAADPVAAALRHLIELDKASARRFRRAAERARDPGASQLLRVYADSRDLLARELRARLPVGADRTPATPSSPPGVVQRWWLDIRRRFTPEEEDRFLGEIEAAESALARVYEEVLRSVRNPPLQDVLRRHHVLVTGVGERVREARFRGPSACLAAKGE